MKNIKTFQENSEIFRYLLDEFQDQSKVILARSSTTEKPFSDIDVYVYGDKKKKPYYEIAILQDKLLLITIYFYSYKTGEFVNLPENVEVIYGEYNKNLRYDFLRRAYNQEEKIKRQTRLITNFVFEYLQHAKKKK